MLLGEAIPLEKQKKGDFEGFMKNLLRSKYIWNNGM